MGLPIWQVDAFTGRPFRGNPAAVCILPAPRDDAWMQDLAREMNLSETAFLLREADGWRLRWMTPAIEVDLCGHATLASAHVLWEEAHLAPDAEARFYTRSGPLSARRRGDWIALDFPALPSAPAADAPDLGPALGVRPLGVHRSRFDLVVEVDSEGAVRGARPDFLRLAAMGVRGVILTGPSQDPAFDFVSRFFAPGSGVDEDPVTGSAHCALAPFWAPRLRKQEMTGYQASARGGVVRVRLAGDRVELQGQAVTVLRGELRA
jgi:predicted PhzF superfamily epimerase YddE/YHI9